MINAVNSLPNVQGVNIQGANNGVSINQVQTQTSPINANLNGANALAAYNKPYVSSKPRKLQPSLPTIMLPDAIQNYLMKKGSCIKSSSGELNSIVMKNDKTTVVYTMDPLAPTEAISKIETFDNKTNKLVGIQENFYTRENGKIQGPPCMEIRTFDEETGKEKTGTYYDHGKLFSVIEKETLPDGTQRTYIANYDRKEIVITDVNEKNGTGKQLYFDNKIDLKKVIERDFNNYKTVVTEYKDGKAVSREVKTNDPIPNTTGYDPLTDEKLTPASPIILDYDPTKVEGEKLYYSNGVLESVRTNTADGEVVHTFKPNGNIEGIDYNMGKKSVLYGSDYQTIKEEIAPDVYKSTTYNNNGTTCVSIINEKENTEQTLFTEKTGKHTYYEQTKDYRRCMEFDAQNNLRIFEEEPIKPEENK